MAYVEEGPDVILYLERVEAETLVDILGRVEGADPAVRVYGALLGGGVVDPDPNGYYGPTLIDMREWNG